MYVHYYLSLTCERIGRIKIGSTKEVTTGVSSPIVIARGDAPQKYST